MPARSLTTAALPWLVAGWIATVVVISVLIYSIVRVVLGKTDPHSLPEVLRALSPLLHGLVRALAKLPTGLPANEMTPLQPQVSVTGDTPPEFNEKAS